MPTKIKFLVESVTLEGELNDSPTAERLAAALPLTGSASRWGEEYYFSVPVKAEEEPGAREVMAVGELGFWPVGSALCVFWGPTPASSGKEPVAASPVNPVGRVTGDFKALAKLGGRVKVRVEKG
jgi:hypothetical protein